MNINFYFNGKENSGKTFLLNEVLDKKEEEELEIKKIKLVTSYYTSPEEVEEYIFKNITTIKKTGEKYVEFEEDVNIETLQEYINKGYAIKINC